MGFPFGYIVPNFEEYRHISRRFYDGDLEDVPSTGNAPVLVRTEDYRRLVPIWVQLVVDLQEDAEAVQKFGWVREMYAYSFAAARAKVKHFLPAPPLSPLMVRLRHIITSVAEEKEPFLALEERETKTS